MASSVASNRGRVREVDLSEHHVITLERAVPFPEAYDGNIYGFDPVKKQVLASLLRRARQLAVVIGFGGGTDGRTIVRGGSGRFSASKMRFGRRKPIWGPYPFQLCPAWWCTP